MFGSGLLSAKGAIKPWPFAIAVSGIYVVNLVLSNYLNLGFLARGGIIPFLLLQGLLTWFWYMLHAKRLADAGRGTGVAKTIAIIFLLFISLVALIAMGSQPPPQNSQPTETTLGGIISLLLFAFILSGSGFGGLGYYFAFIAAIPLFCILLIFAYSIVVGMRKSLTPEPLPVV
jgi:uncharacterized membrane protein YhaH (DUF805 family)